MKNARPIYQNILAIGGGTGEDPSTARIGGHFRQPTLSLSYLLAARHVIETGERTRRLNEIALPASYLQRHALELALKELIEVAYDIGSYSEWVRLMETNPSSEQPALPAAPFGHDFERLRDRLETALASIGYELPDGIASLTRELRDAERLDPTRFRYLTGPDREERFRTEEILRVVEVQEKLEEMFHEHLMFQDFLLSAAEWNLTTSLAAEGEALFQRVITFEGGRAAFGFSE